MAKARVVDYKVTRIVSRQDLADWFGQHGHPRVRVRMSILKPNVGYAYLPYSLNEWDAALLLELVHTDLVIGGEVHIVSGWWAWFFRGILGLGHRHG